jgi:triosephosphate isomerase
MHKTTAQARELASGLARELADYDWAEVVLIPPATAISTVAEAAAGTKFGVGGQNLFWEEQGAYTGEISPVMLKDLGCTYVIIGHSERRGYFGETDEDVAKKVRAALDHDLCPIVCVGESLEEREAGKVEEVISTQVKAALSKVSPAEAAKVVIAYEPIWAIGTGRSASAEDAQEVISFIRSEAGKILGEQEAAALRIQYGGSVKPENINQFMAQPDIDGALVGGASLSVEQFSALLRAAVVEGK